MVEGGRLAVVQHNTITRAKKVIATDGEVFLLYFCSFFLCSCYLAFEASYGCLLGCLLGWASFQRNENGVQERKALMLVHDDGFACTSLDGIW